MPYCWEKVSPKSTAGFSGFPLLLFKLIDIVLPTSSWQRCLGHPRTDDIRRLLGLHHTIVVHPIPLEFDCFVPHIGNTNSSSNVHLTAIRLKARFLRSIALWQILSLVWNTMLTKQSCYRGGLALLSNKEISKWTLSQLSKILTKI